MTFFFGFSMIVGGNFEGVGQYEVYDVLAVYDAADECKIAAKRTEYRVGRQYGAAWDHSDRDDDPAAEHLAVSRAYGCDVAADAAVHADLRTPVCKKSGRISAKAVR